MTEKDKKDVIAVINQLMVEEEIHTPGNIRTIRPWALIDIITAMPVDEPQKNADGLLEEIISAIDTMIERAQKKGHKLAVEYLDELRDVLSSYYEMQLTLGTGEHTVKRMRKPVE